MRPRRALLLGLWLPCAASLLVPGAARAQPARANCSSTTADGAAPRVISYGKDNTRAVVIAPGQTLCLSLGLDPESSGTFVNGVRTAPASYVLAVTLTVTGNRTTLRLRNPYAVELRYRAAVYSGNLVRETYVRPVPPRSEQTESWNEALPALVLYDLRLDPTVEREDVPAHDPVSSWSLGLLGGAMWSTLDHINADLRRHGYGAESSLSAVFGIGFEGEADWFAGSLELVGGTARAGEERSPDIWQFAFVAQGGYRLLGTRTLSAAPMLGLAGGAVHMDVAPNPDEPELSIARLEHVRGASGVERDALWLVASFGVQYRFLFFSSDRSMFAGVRAGYLVQVAQGDWALWTEGADQSEDVPDGPELDASGPYLRLLVGISVL